MMSDCIWLFALAHGTSGTDNIASAGGSRSVFKFLSVVNLVTFVPTLISHLCGSWLYCFFFLYRLKIALDSLEL